MDTETTFPRFKSETPMSSFRYSDTELNLSFSDHGTPKGPVVEERRVRRLIRNREAAKKNRYKKKEFVETLQKTAMDTIDANEKLIQRAKAYELELAAIKNALSHMGYTAAELELPPSQAEADTVTNRETTSSHSESSTLPTANSP
jgi:hypothetical protein